MPRQEPGGIRRPLSGRAEPKLVLIGTLTLLAALLVSVVRSGSSTAGVTATAVRQIGGEGHAGLYGWGAATLRDGSVLIGDYWNYRIVHYAKDGRRLGVVVSESNAGTDPGKHQSPYGIAVDPRNDDVYFGDVDGGKTVDKYRADGTFVRDWGANGSGPGKFKYPSQLAVASDGRVYVADQWDHNIVVHDPDGRELFQFGTNGGGDGQFRQPRGLAFDAADRLYVADNYNRRIEVFDAGGRFLSQWGSSGTEPGQFSPGNDLRGVAIDKQQGWIYVVDAASGFINKYTLNGTYLLRFGGFGSTPGKFLGGGRNLTVDGDGNVWVGDMPGFRAQKFSPTGQFLLAVPDPAEPPPDGGFNQPRGVAVDAAGNVFVTDTHNWRVEKFARDGQFLLAWGRRGGGEGEDFNYQRGIAVDRRDGAVVVTDTDNHKIKKFTNSGALVWSVGKFGTAPGQFTNPHSIDVGPDGRIYVADTQNFRVQILSETGAPLAMFGSKGTGPGQFQFPRGIVVDRDGTLWVSDSLRGIVEHFTPTGQFLGQIGALGTADNQLLRAADVQVDEERIYVADVDTDKVKVWTKAGVFVGVFGGNGSALGQMRRPHGMDIGPDGHLYVVEQAGERVQEFVVQVGNTTTTLPDTQPPNVEVAVPTNGQVFTFGPPVAMSGTATDNTALRDVEVAIKDNATGRWWRSDGTFGAFQWQRATMTAPGAAVSGWTFSWGPPGRGSYLVQVRTRDNAGNVDPTRPSVNFKVQ